MSTIAPEADSTAIHPGDILTFVEIAQRVVPPAWGLDGFVAVNPLGGFEDQPFETAVERARDLFGGRGFLDPSVPRPGQSLRSGSSAGVGRPPGTNNGRVPSAQLLRRGTAGVADAVDAFVAHWCASYRSGWVVTADGADDLFHAWRLIARHDPDLRRRSGRRHRDLRAWIDSLPESSAATIAALLHDLGIGEDGAIAYIEAQLTRMPGWVAVMARRIADDTTPGSTFVRHNDVVDLVAVRMAIERILLGWPDPRPDADAQPLPVEESAPTSESHARGFDLDAQQRAAQRQTTAEVVYRDALLSLLSANDPNVTANAAEPLGTPQRPLAQMVCCIDVRSEGLRRHLEAAGPYETLGFAGFFGLPIAVRTVTATHAVPSCPVILDPRTTIPEHVVAGHLPQPGDRDVSHRSFHAAKAGTASGFVLADASGWLLGLRSITQALFPGFYQRSRRRARRLVERPLDTRFALDPDDARPGEGLSLEEQTALAFGALRAMGLTDGFAPFVIICGHRSENLNNPYRSGSDCGACAGHAGGPNARILAAICNRVEVRKRLAELGIVIADDTLFVAAEHETTDDVVRLLDTGAIDGAQRATLQRIQHDLDRAGLTNRAERQRSFPASPLPWGETSRASDPAQVVPDWGLARCAAIVVGPRALTAGVDLERRVFLHSYRPDDDPDGLVLEAVMTGPVVVAHWICSQYYFSTVDPEAFGAGSKPLQNVIDRVGVSVGAGVDLRIGLPLESVWFDGRPVHDPLRLLVVVDAPSRRVEAVIARNPVLRRLFDNGWATIVARDTDDPAAFSCRSRDGEWARWSATGSGIGHDVDLGADNASSTPCQAPKSGRTV